jgi:hypothetical protein
MNVAKGRSQAGRSWGWASAAHPALAGLLVLLLAACGRHAAPPPQVAAPALAPISPLARLYYDNSGGIQDSVRLVVRDANALASVWQRATSGQASPPVQPTVDFSKEMVIVVGAGRMTPDDQIRVDSVGMRKENADGKVRDILTAWVSTIESCRRFRADAYPVEIVRVRRFEGTVRFAEQRVKPTGCH